MNFGGNMKKKLSLEMAIILPEVIGFASSSKDNGTLFTYTGYFLLRHLISNYSFSKL